jgi:hypothetical protein
MTLLTWILFIETLVVKGKGEERESDGRRRPVDGKSKEYSA